MNASNKPASWHKKYGVVIIGVEADGDCVDGLSHIEHLSRNARTWGVDNQVIGLNLGVPETHLAANTFDFVHCITPLEMIRGFFDPKFYLRFPDEIYSILRLGGIFTLG